MTLFSVSFSYVCPTDWDKDKLKEYLERMILVGKEKDTLQIKLIART